MNDLFSIGYFRENDPDTFRVDFGDDSPHSGLDNGRYGTVFNLSDREVMASGSPISVGSMSFYLPDGTSIPLDNFTPDVLASLSGFYNSEIRFRGTDANDVFDLSGLRGATEDGSLNHLEYVLTEGTDTVIFPDGGQTYNFELGSGTLASRKLFEDQFWSSYSDGMIDPSFMFTGLNYQFTTDTDVTVTTSSTGVTANLTAQNVYKIFDSPYTDDTFLGTTGSQQFRSEGGYDYMTGGPGSDVFRIDGSMLTADWADPKAYKAIGHNVFISDYEYGERISIEDFGLTNASDIWSEVSPSGYTNIYIDGLVDESFRQLASDVPAGTGQRPYTVQVSNYDAYGNWVDPSEAELIFTDFNGNSHVVATLDELPGQNRFGSMGGETNVASIGNGNYLIAYSVRDESVPGPMSTSDIYYRIFDTEYGDFTGPSMFIGSSEAVVEAINVEYQEEGRVTLSPQPQLAHGFVAEVNADYYGFSDYTFRTLNSPDPSASGETIYTVSRPMTDENGNWIGAEQADIIFTDLQGERHVVAARSDLASGERFGNIMESNASSLGNGNYLIAYAVRNDNNPSAGTDLYYRVFDPNMGGFTSGKKLLGSTENYTVEGINVELHEEGRVVLTQEPYTAHGGFSAEVRQDDDGYLSHDFRQISNMPEDNEQQAYSVTRRTIDENGAHISHDQADIIFTDLNGVSHVVADHSEMAAGSNVRFGNNFGQNNVSSMGNGNYLIAFTVRNDSGAEAGTDLYYRIFDTETGGFTGLPKLFGSTQQSVEGINVELHDNGRVILSPEPSMSGGFVAEISDSGQPLNLVTLQGLFETGVVYSRGDEHSDAGTDYGIMFYNPNMAIGGNTPEWQGDDDFSVFGNVWKPELDVSFLGATDRGLLLQGGDGKDEFSGGPGDDRFEGGAGKDAVIYFDSQGIDVYRELNDFGRMETLVYDGMGYGGVDTLDSIRDIYASTGDDYINISSSAGGVERVILSTGNDTVVGNMIVGYWNLYNSPEDPRYADEGDGGVKEGVTNAKVEVNIADGQATKVITGGEFAGTYTDTLIGIGGIVGSEGHDILNVTTDEIVRDASGDNAWAHGLIGNDLVEDLGSGYDWLTGGHGDDVIISGNYVDTVWGDWKSDYYQVSGSDTFAVYGDGYTTIEDWEVGEQVWWLDVTDTIGASPTLQDLVVTHDYGDQSTKIGVQDSTGQVVNRLEVSGFLEVESIHVEQFNKVGASALINSGANDIRLVLVESDSTVHQVTDLGEGSDKFYGGEEFDLVTTGGGADYLSLGAGDDIALVEGTVLMTDQNPYFAAANYAFIDTGSGDDIVEISTDFAGEVRLVSGGGTDTLVINADVGAFSWGAGMAPNQNDIVLTSANSSIVLADQMSYEDNQVFSYIEFVSTDPVTGQETSQIFQIDPNAPPLEGAMVTLLGTDFDDDLSIDWDSGPASIAGLKGDDIIGGGVSDDNLDGGEGDDFLSGNGGEDQLSGGFGEDFLDGGHGSDKLYGGRGDDVYKIDLDYSGFLDRAGYDNPEQNRDDIVIGNVDCIVDDEGSDRIWLTNFQPTLNPFDQYKEMLSIQGDGTLVMKWGWDAESPSSYQYTLREGYEHEIFDPNVAAAQDHGGYVVTKADVNSPIETPKYTWPVFKHEYQAENFYREQNGLSWDAPATVHKVQFTPNNITFADQTGHALDNAPTVPMIEFWVPGPEGSVNESNTPDFVSYPGMVNIAETLYHNKIENDYGQGGNLSSLVESGQNTRFDLGRIETWPGFDQLPEAIDPTNPEEGTQEYYLQRFDISDPATFPSDSEMPFIKVMTGYSHPDGYQVPGYLVSMESLAPGDSRGGDNYDTTYSNGGNGQYSAALEQGFEVKDFAVKDEHGNWVNTIESIVFTSPTTERDIIDQYGASIQSGATSVYDSLTQALTTNQGTEYFLSPSGVVDLGTVRVPSTFNTDGSVATYTETNSWSGVDTDKNFFLVANTSMAGQNDLGLGFMGSTDSATDKSDPIQAAPLYVHTTDILTSGAAKDDIIFGHDGWSYVDVMFGHGGDDAMQAEGGENYVVGGSGADKFIIEATGQNTVIFGDHVGIKDDNSSSRKALDDFEIDSNGNRITYNESHGDTVFFDFTWPLVGRDGAKGPDSYIEQLGKGHFKVHHKLENGEVINVEMYDVEGAYFSDGEGGLEYRALTTGRPITQDDFGPLAYETQKVKFLVEHDDPEVGGATSIAVVTTTPLTYIDPETNLSVSYENPIIHWKGLASEADSFEFSDVTVNVVNISQTDLTGSQIVDTTVYGTAGIDLIIGDEFDNLIYGGADNDIIFGGDGRDEIYGEGGDDVLIGGDMDDILYGDFKYDVDEPDAVYDASGTIVMNADEITGDDIIIGGTGIDKIDSGDGENVVASGDLSSVILNTELDQFNTFIDYDDDEIPE